jgi:putative methyltransferase (TIGR04325 family)
MFKHLIKILIPRYLITKINILLKRDIKIIGSFKNWKEAVKNSGTYNNDRIFKNSKKSFLKVINNKAKFERDSVIFSQEKLNEPLIKLMEKIRKKNNKKKLVILDYGGSFGSTYFQNKKVLSNKFCYQWDIIEQKKIVNFANRSIKFDNLTFQTSLNNYLKKNRPNIVLFSSVIHYLETPFEIILKLINKKVDYFLILNTPFFQNETKIKIQINPKNIYEANYPIRIFNENFFKYFFLRKKYKISKLHWDNQVIDGINFKSFFIKKR